MPGQLDSASGPRQGCRNRRAENTKEQSIAIPGEAPRTPGKENGAGIARLIAVTWHGLLAQTSVLQV